MNDDKNVLTKTREYIRDNLVTIALVLLCIVWMVMGFVTLKLTGKTTEEVVADSLMLMMFGLTINRMCTIMGIKKGKQTQKYIDTNNLHGDKVTEASKDINSLVRWCDKENYLNKKDIQAKKLAPLGISYDDFIKDNIDYSRWEKPNKIKKKVLKIKNIKLHQISVDALTTIIDDRIDKFYYGRSEKRYKKSESIIDFISKPVIYIILGLMAVDLITNFSYGNLILKLIQLVILLSSGAMKYANAYTFIVDEFRAGTIKKINDLDRFLNEQKREDECDVRKETNIIR
jgi:hypothetical protein